MVRVVFLHPDLGIGGAERAVIDAALALKSSGHSVHFVTAHHDPDHCFPETRDGTVAVTAVGDWLPRSVLNRFYALCAYIRMIYAAVYLVFFSRIQYDVVFCDQISACIPVLRVGRAKVLFYCHFPDMLLTQRRSFLKRLYRAPIDRLEELTTGLAHVVLVNSKFTADVFHETFRSLQDIKPQVVYPIPNFTALDQPADNQLPDNVLAITANINTIFLSINRYERKKNLPLALHALAKLKARRGDLDGVQLIIAGGYDDRVMENKEHYLELRMLADSLKVQGHISFMRSFSDGEKRTLLHHSTCLLYTPDKEHFGIVPVEAMYLQCPVIAVRSGGPLETVLDGQTGYLCSPEADSFADAMEKFVTDRKLGAKLGKAGRQRVIEKFSFETFTKQLNSTMLGLCQP